MLKTEGELCMARDAMPVGISSLDEQRFGVRTAKALGVTTSNLPAVLQFCAENDVALLIARCSVDDLPAAHAMERAGFLLMDTLVYWSRDLVDKSLPNDSGPALIRPIRPDEAGEVKRIAGEAFRGYFGHYHADERLDNAACDEVYSDWAYRSCISAEMADFVLIAELENNIVGFATGRLNNPKEGEGVLSGVAPDYRGRGIHRSLMIGRLRWFHQHGAERMVISTQVTNVAAQNSWLRLGFEPSHALYTFHKWFD